MTDRELRKAIRTIANFPVHGIQFRDFTPILLDPGLVRKAVELLIAPFADTGITRVAGIESRGFILGAMMAQRLGAGFIPIRKKGKLPGETISQEYDLEYGSDTLEVHAADLNNQDQVLVHDDLIATGGTAQATELLIQKAGAEVAGYSFLVEIDHLDGRARLSTMPKHSVVHF